MKPFVALALLLALAACGGPDMSSGAISPATINVANAALSGGLYSLAISVSDAILAKYPRDAAALATKADALLGNGDVAGAEAAYRAALAIDPVSVRATVGLGRIKLRSDPAAAEAQFLLALQRDPRNVAALSDLGVARDLQGRHAEAQQAYRQALGLAPDNIGAQVNLGLSLALSGKPDDAVHVLGPLAALPGAPDRIRDDLALANTLAGKPEAPPRALAEQNAGTTPRAHTGAAAEAAAAPAALLSRAVTESSLASPAANAPHGVMQVAANVAPLRQASAAAAMPQHVPPAADLQHCRTLSLAASGCPLVPPRQGSTYMIGWPYAVTCAMSPGLLPPAPPAIASLSTFALAVSASDGWAPHATATSLVMALASPDVAELIAPPLPSLLHIPADKLLSASLDPPPPSSVSAAGINAAAGQRRGADTSRAGWVPFVQVAALDSQDAAQRAWAQLVARLPDLLAGHAPVVVPAEIGGRTFWRLRTDGFETLRDAKAFCDRATTAGTGCWATLASR